MSQLVASLDGGKDWAIDSEDVVSGGITPFGEDSTIAVGESSFSSVSDVVELEPDRLDLWFADDDKCKPTKPVQQWTEVVPVGEESVEYRPSVVASQPSADLVMQPGHSCDTLSAESLGDALPCAVPGEPGVGLIVEIPVANESIVNQPSVDPIAPLTTHTNL